MASARAMLAAVDGTANVDLGARQREAIAFRDGHLLLLAGPGTGKTETLARRAAALIDCARAAGGEQPEILMLTFARKAARELRERVALHLCSGGRLPACSTFHAFALETLDRSRPRAPGAAGMLTPAKERLLIERVCRVAVDNGQVSTGYFTPQALKSAKFATDAANFIARCKQARVDAAGVLSAAMATDGLPTRLALLTLAGLYRSYEDEQRRLGLRDFRDLVNAAVDALRATPRRYAYVFVDELQDTDPAQLDLLSLLAGAGAQITAVGDPNQSIYRFRNVAPAAIEDFRARFAPGTIVLQENHRCPPEVLACANRLARAPREGDVPLDPVLSCESLTRSVAGHAGAVRWLCYRDRSGEAAGIAREIRRLVGAPRAATGAHPLRYADVAVLLRETRGHAERIAFALRAQGIPVVRADAAEALGDPAIDFVLTYLAALGEPADGQRLARLLSSPVVGIRARALRFARRALGEASFADLAALANSAELSERERARIANFAAAFAAHRSRWRRLGARDLVVSIARAHDVAAAITAPHRDREAQATSARRLRTLIDLAGDVDAVFGGSPGAAAHLAERASELFGLLAETEGPPEGEGVHVLSMHAAKGLEFPLVFVAGAVRGRLPAQPRPDPLLDEAAQEALFHAVNLPRTPTAQEQRDEELRLFYVACTRAAEHLVLTSYTQDEGADLAPSPFIERAGIGEPSEGGGDVLDEDERVLALRRLTSSGVHVDDAVHGAAARRIVSVRQAFESQPPATPALPSGALSPSAIECYLRCPRQFFYRYVVRAQGDERESASALLGTVLHAALSDFHERYPGSEQVIAAGEEASARALEAAIAHALERERERPRNARLGEQPALVAMIAERARDYARRYLRWLEDQPRFAVRERELKVTFSLTASDGRTHTLTGRIDRVDETADGVVIRDYKTGRDHPFAARFRRLATEEALPLGGALDGVVQLPLYAAALTQRDPQAKIVALDLLFLRGRSPAERTSSSRLATLGAAEGASNSVARDALTQRELDAGLTRIADLCGDLYDGRAGYAPQPGDACAHCPFRTACDRVAVDGESGGVDAH
ncbi:ATP-dependent helicase [bacterium]|nr:MAG: ATP-dependent helicase [bacterium]